MQVNPTTYPISWFRDRNREQSLILRPPYQRKPVWTPRQQAYLIDTIIKGYHIPELYIHRETNLEGKAIYSVVDGQQRIRSILDFINDALSLLDEFTPEYADYNFEDLPETTKRKFWGYTLYVREITDATEDEVRNMFKRMNRYVVALNPQELRHATYQGDFIKLMEEIAEDDFWAENKIVTTNEIRRMNDVQFISDLFISLMNGIQDKTKEMDKYYEHYEKEFPEKSKWHKLFEKIVDTISEIFSDLKETRWHNKSDFYTLFMVLGDLNKSQLYIPISDYKKVRKQLLRFSFKVAEATNKENKSKKFSKDVIRYVNAVIKSTTDKDRRVLRHKIIYKILLKYAKNFNLMHIKKE